MKDHNAHEWTMFVKAKDRTVDLSKYIRRVTYDLMPGFNPIINHRDKAPFELKRRGWGTFMIDIKIHFFKKYNKPPVEYEHYLVFDGAGRWRTRTISLKKVD